MERPCLPFCVVLLLVQCIWSFQAMTVINATTADDYALLAFKAHIIASNPHHMLEKNWSTTTSICNWIGVICSSRHKRVAALSLPLMDLRGTIPPSIGNLSFLVSLDVSNNSFHGHLPKELAHLRRLKEINLEFNYFIGDLPSWFSVLPKLKNLFLTSNNFSGTIPPALCNISTLEILFLRSNFLHGNIPHEIGNLSNLIALEVGQNELTGSLPLTLFKISSLVGIDVSENSLSGKLPSDICYHLPNLQKLRLSFNELYGQIPWSIDECSKLSKLSLSHNNFSGLIPRKIGNLTMLKVLYLGFNNLIGEIPQEIGNPRSLEQLTLEVNGLSGIIPQQIGSLLNLEILSLSFTSIKGTIPATIFNISTLRIVSLVANHLSGKLPSNIGHNLPNLDELDLGLNELIGFLPESISNASKLSHLDLSSNKLTGTIPHSLGKLMLLEVLYLGGNNFIGESSQELSFLTPLTNCRRLKALDLSENPLNGVFPVSIGNLSNSLKMFYASYCGIKGNFPNEIGNLSSLIYLNIYANELTGFIPRTIKALRKLQVLQLHENVIGGSIPNDLCQLQNLGLFSLSTNQIVGSIPECLGNVTSLRYLYLSFNRLTSSIPASLGNIKDLLEFNLSSNSLSGHLPFEIGNLKVVVAIDLSFNQFSGNIPSTIGGLQNLVNFSLAHNRLQGPIPETFQNLISLEILDLSRNYLVGVIPKSLEALLHLRYFNVSFNRLQGEIPGGGPFKNFTNQSFLWNEALCGARRFQVPPCHTSSIRGSREKRVLLLVCLPLLIASIILTLTCGLMLKRCRRNNEVPNPTELLPTITYGRISYYELQRATDGFDESNLLGRGSFGSVYKGIFTEGMICAVKVFELKQEGAFKSFDAECEVLGNLRHRNLTKVITSCSRHDFKALILEYMPNGSLEKWLYSHNHFLDILQRIDIMIDVACALDYLHQGYSMPVIHCDLKPSNVLLDEDMVAHLSDFGIAKLLSGGDSIAQTKTIATFGYISPEYGLEGLVSTRSDVYSYGIMLMETFTRMKPSDEMFHGDLSIKRWVNDSLPNAITQIIDANLTRPEQEHLNVKVKCISSIMELALSCSVDSPKERLNMKDVLATLRKTRLWFLENREMA